MNPHITEELLKHRNEFRNNVNPVQAQRLRELGKLQARERIELLLDKNSFREFGLFAHSQHPGLERKTPADGVVTGTGRIEGRLVAVYADDASVLAGTRGKTADTKLMRFRELVLAHKLPLIALNEAGAARVQETQGAMAAILGEVFEQYFKLSGLVPLICVHFGASYGGPTFYGAQSDFTVLVKDSGSMGMSGPPVVKVGLGLEHTHSEIGGADMAMNVTGQVEYIADSEADALEAVRTYLSYVPQNAYEMPPSVPSRPSIGESRDGAKRLQDLVPDNLRHAYNMHKLIELVVDEGSLFEIRSGYGKNLITTLARMGGKSVGIVANNPLVRAGALDDKAAIKARKFIDTCDAFHIPLIFFCDTPGFIVGPEMEKQRIVSLSMRLMSSLLQAKVPRIQVVIRKAIGMAYIAMCGRAVRPDATVAWPIAIFDVIGPEAAVMLAHGKEILASEDPAGRRRELLEQFSGTATAYAAGGLSLVDDVIAPGETRQFILDRLECAQSSYSPSFRHRVDP